MVPSNLHSSTSLRCSALLKDPVTRRSRSLGRASGFPPFSRCSHSRLVSSRLLPARQNEHRFPKDLPVAFRSPGFPKDMLALGDNRKSGPLPSLLLPIGIHREVKGDPPFTL